MFSATNADVVSVASPGSSEGGSLPIAIRSVPPACPPAAEPVPVFALLLELPPPQPAATRARASPATVPRAQDLLRCLRMLPPRRLDLLEIGFVSLVTGRPRGKPAGFQRSRVAFVKPGGGATPAGAARRAGRARRSAPSARASRRRARTREPRRPHARSACGRSVPRARRARERRRR